MSKTGKNVPTKLPMVESAYTRPLKAPTPPTSEVHRRMAKGLTIPKAKIGGAKINAVAKNDPENSSIDHVLQRNPSSAGETGGIKKANNPAQQIRAQKGPGRGYRSARTPPNQYPLQRANIITPMMLVQTAMDVPNHGASSREALISIAIVETPHTNVENNTYPLMERVVDEVIRNSGWNR